MLQRRSAFYFLFLNIPIMGHVLLIPLLWDVAGRDAWIAAIVTFPIAIIIAYMTWKILNISPNKSLPEKSIELWGRGLGTVVNMIWAIYFLYLASLTVSGLAELLHAGFFEETPSWFFGAFFMIFILYAISKGIKVVAWSAGVITVFILISGHTISGLLTEERNWRNLLPFFEHGWTPIIFGAIVVTAMWVEIIPIAVLKIRKSETKGLFYILLLGAFANLFMVISVAAGTISVFGMEQVQLLTHAVLNSVRMVSLGIIDRFDVYGLMLMTFGSFIRTCFYLHAFMECLPKLVKRKFPKITLLFSGALVYAISLYFYQDKLFFDMVVSYYVATIIFAVLPIFYIVTNALRKGKSNQTTSLN